MTTTPPKTTVAELLLALASYPQDAEVVMSDPYIELGVLVADEYHAVYRPHEGVAHYGPPRVIVRVVERNEPGDDYATAVDFLAWLRANDVELVHPGHGHGEGSMPMRKATRDNLAQRFAQRPIDIEGSEQ